MTHSFITKYLDLESQIIELATYIRFDDTQYGVHSDKIGELILNIVTEIESISKELYKKSTGDLSSNKKFDFDCIEYFIKNWDLDKKVVLINHLNFFFTNKNIFPFVKDEVKSSNGAPIFGWNNAYQHIKHDKLSSSNFQTIKYLLNSLAALYLLIVYYEDQQFKALKQTALDSFDTTLSSKIFKVKLHRSGIKFDNSFIKEINFEECALICIAEKNSYEVACGLNDKMLEIKKDLMFKDAVEKLGYPNMQIIMDGNGFKIDNLPTGADQNTVLLEFLKQFQDLGDPFAYEIKAMQQMALPLSNALSGLLYDVILNKKQY